MQILTKRMKQYVYRVIIILLKISFTFSQSRLLPRVAVEASYQMPWATHKDWHHGLYIATQYEEEERLWNSNNYLDFYRKLCAKISYHGASVSFGVSQMMQMW